MGDVHVHQRIVDFLLGNRNNSVAAATLPPEQNLSQDGRLRYFQIAGNLQCIYFAMYFQHPSFHNGSFTEKSFFRIPFLRQRSLYKPPAALYPSQQSCMPHRVYISSQ